jgi:phosphoribosyl-AMP cyclohydrolase
MKTLKTIAFLILVSFTSCTITQEYHFNKDFSGNTKLSIDMGTFMQMMAGMDSTGSSTRSMKDSLNIVFDESAQKLKDLGVKNIKLGWEENSDILYMSYDFDNIDILNNALNAANAQNATISKTISDEPHTYFSRKRKTLIYKGPKSSKDAPKDMESMSEYYQYALIFTFDRKVKKVDNPNVTLSPDGQKVELKGSMFKVIKTDFNSDIKFKLK